MEIGLEQARAKLGDLVNRAEYGRETTYLTRHGRRVAAIVPVQEPTMAITADTVHAIARTMTPHCEGDWTLSYADLLAMTEPSDWVGDRDDLTPDAARAVADDLNERQPWA